MFPVDGKTKSLYRRCIRAVKDGRKGVGVEGKENFGVGV